MDTFKFEVICTRIRQYPYLSTMGSGFDGFGQNMDTGRKPMDEGMDLLYIKTGSKGI